MKIEAVEFFYLSMPVVTTEADGSQDAMVKRWFDERKLEQPVVANLSFVDPLCHIAVVSFVDPLHHIAVVLTTPFRFGDKQQ
jgi:hypothetical protein